MKRAIRYLRFSNLGQSNGSIERQELYTDQWLQFNKVELVDTFVDRGKSAKTFDRPDFIKLQEFIARHHKHVDYLLVDQMDRFSRDAGEAMTLVKNLQKKFNIQVVSVTEGITFDYDTPGSFFRAGLQLLLAEEDNINRSIKIRGGNYTARAKEGRFLSNLAPFGYWKVGEGKDRTLEIDEQNAKIIRFIFDAYLRDMPLYKIKAQAVRMGFDRNGNTAIRKVLQNPAYAGMVRARAFKDHPGGLFPAIHEPIIDKKTWQAIQNKMAKPEKTRTLIDDEIPLRGLLKCHCGQPLTGAASRGRHGGYYYYYKCKISGHNTINAGKAHNQLSTALGSLPLSVSHVNIIRKNAIKAIEKELAGNKALIKEQTLQLEKLKERLLAVEEKWINDQITKDAYERWSGNYNTEISSLKSSIFRLNIDHSPVFLILDKHMQTLTDLKYVYDQADSMKKRVLISLGFDSNLYYENGVYKTPTILEAFIGDQMKLSGNSLLIL
jgi:DNA invertase Pin-like site-specific DNA recombinase